MRIVVACLLLAACERVPAARQDPPAPSPMPTTPKPPSPADLERLRSELARLSPNDNLYLAELGWFALYHYKSYEGRNPRTGERVVVPERKVLFFRAHPNVLHALNSEPKETLADPLHYWDDDRATRHAAWADELAASTKKQLLEHGRAELAGVGTLQAGPPSELPSDEDDEDTSSRKRVRWQTDAAMQRALAQ